MIHIPYLVIMSTLVVAIAGLSIPSLFWPKCPHCGRRTWVAKEECSHCGSYLPDDLDL
ncbi:MAG: hypothetical protein GX117_05830 [Candidatus Hydrogenedentes bacterium]|jgi:rRNA maturation protein Nop10|nr:hypothetical protein [Candidatus Hydrogenedentota bacterium]